MLAIISDLHLQHTSDDGIRYSDGDTVRCLAVERNVGVRAFQRFVSMLHERARRCDAASVQLVLGGDVFEIHRSPRWFDVSDGFARPYTRPQDGSKEWDALRRKVEAILDDIVRDNNEFFENLRALTADGVYRFSSVPAKGARRRSRRTYFRNMAGQPIPIEVHYIPGNHDRLLNAWPSTRERVRECLGMAGGAAPFPQWLDSALTGAGDTYRTRVRHGHEYDAANFPSPVTGGDSPMHAPSDYRGPCLGDFATVDVGTRLTLAFRVHNACQLRQQTGQACRDLYMKLTEFDDVRPMTELGTYLLASREAGTADEARWLLPALRDVCAAARRSAFLGREIARLKIGQGLAGEGVALLDPVLGTAPAWGLYPLIRAITWLVSLRGGGSAPVDFAVREPGLGGDVRLVVAGHTHYPEVVPLTGVGGDECFFLDSGTWRTIVPHGPGGFGHLRAYTIVFVYSDRESAYIGHDDRRFETWTGYLVPDRPALPEAGKLCMAPRRQRITFTRLVVERVPEDGVWFAKGAELDLRVGVDGVACRPFRKRVRAGDSCDLEGMTAALDQELDGELWCHAVEQDVAFDDILPWGLRRLARDADGNFAEGDGKLVMEDAAARIVLHYDVRAE